MHIDFVDQTLRDGQQSHWGLKMRAYDAADALPHLRDTGFRTIDLTGPGMFQVLTRDFHDDPWATTDFMARGLAGNQLRAGMRTHSVIGFQRAPESIIDLWVRTLIKHGVTSFWIYDCAYDMPTMKRLSDYIVSEGGQSVPTVMYGLTAVHDDAFFAARAAEMASWDGVDAIEVEDAPGILKPDRAKTLLPAIRQAVQGLPLELHCHNNAAMAEHNYMIGIQAGFDRVHTASRPMANGVSLPSTESMIGIVEYLGGTHSLDTSQLGPVAENFIRQAAAGGYRTGQPVEHDPRVYDHQLPGGMTGSLRAQLAKHGMEHRLPEVLEAIPQVRLDFGEPIMATPFSQFVGIQAVLNVVTGDPYTIIPDEVFHYIMGHYGPIHGKLNENVRDKILSNPRAKAFESWEKPSESLASIRKRFSPGISDEELLLRYMTNEVEVDAMLAAGPIQTDPRYSANAILNHIQELVATRGSATSLSLTTPEMRVRLARRTR
ncbi:MAG: carboxyltransferase [Actinomycetota bacterium]